MLRGFAGRAPSSFFLPCAASRYRRTICVGAFLLFSITGERDIMRLSLVHSSSSLHTQVHSMQMPCCYRALTPFPPPPARLYVLTRYLQETGYEESVIWKASPHRHGMKIAPHDACCHAFLCVSYPKTFSVSFLLGHFSPLHFVFAPRLVSHRLLDA